PAWDRWPRGLPDDSYHQNVLKGDYPIFGTQNLFLNITALSDTFAEARRLPVGFATQDQRQVKQTFLTEDDLLQGDNTFHPSEWFLRATPIYQLTDQSFADTTTDFALQEGFLDLQLKIFNKYYDQINLRMGRQGFNADFRGFLFNDVEDGFRLF